MERDDSRALGSNKTRRKYEGRRDVVHFGIKVSQSMMESNESVFQQKGRVFLFFTPAAALRRERREDRTTVTQWVQQVLCLLIQTQQQAEWVETVPKTVTLKARLFV